MLNIVDRKPAIISFITKFVENVFRLTHSFPSIGNDEQGIDLEWHLSTSFCSTFADDSISVSIFDAQKHYVEEEIAVSDYFQEEKDLLKKNDGIVSSIFIVGRFNVIQSFMKKELGCNGHDDLQTGFLID